jgi:hypothetical protein
VRFAGASDTKNWPAQNFHRLLVSHKERLCRKSAAC